MNIDLMPFLIGGAVLAAVVIAMAVWRMAASSREDDSIHVLEEASVVQGQAAFASRIATIDKWGKALTVVAVLYGLAVGALYFYQVWMKSSSTTGV